ncbi:hypothetical protein ACFE04_020876 [Oxalis oulophora]
MVSEQSEENITFFYGDGLKRWTNFTIFPSINDEKALEKILDNPWYPSTSSDQMSIMWKTMTRDKKQKWIHKNTQGYLFDRLVNRCVQSFGTDMAIETFGRLGRETGEKEYNAIIKRCIEQAKLCDSDDESLDKFMKAYKIFKGYIWSTAYIFS